MLYFFKSEIKRAIMTKNTFIAIILCIISLYIGQENMLFSSGDHIGSSRIFTYTVYNGTSSLIALLGTTVVAIPFATSYIHETDCNYAMYAKYRLGKFKYIGIKFIINALIGGLVLSIPILIFYIITLVKKGIEPNETIILNQVLSNIYYESQVKYILIQIFMTFIFGCTFSTISLGLSIYLKNKYLTILVPFIGYVSSAMLLDNVNLNAQMIYDLGRNEHLSFNYRLTYALILVLISIFLFLINYFLEE